jgi:hypothetical protein
VDDPLRALGPKPQDPALCQGWHRVGAEVEQVSAVIRATGRLGHAVSAARDVAQISRGLEL